MLSRIAMRSAVVAFSKLGKARINPVNTYRQYVGAVQTALKPHGIDAIGRGKLLRGGTQSITIQFLRSGQQIGQAIRQFADNATRLILSKIDLAGRTGLLRPLYKAEYAFVQNSRTLQKVSSSLWSDTTRRVLPQEFPGAVLARHGKKFRWEKPPGGFNTSS